MPDFPGVLRAARAVPRDPLLLGLPELADRPLLSLDAVDQPGTS